MYCLVSSVYPRIKKTTSLRASAKQSFILIIIYKDCHISRTADFRFANVPSAMTFPDRLSSHKKNCVNIQRGRIHRFAPTCRGINPRPTKYWDVRKGQKAFRPYLTLRKEMCHSRRILAGIQRLFPAGSREVPSLFTFYSLLLTFADLSAQRDFPFLDFPLSDYAVFDVGIVLHEIIDYGRIVAFEDEQSGVGRVVEDSSHGHIAFSEGGLGEFQVFFAERFPLLDEIVDVFVVEEVVHLGVLKSFFITEKYTIKYLWHRPSLYDSFCSNLPYQFYINMIFICDLIICFFIVKTGILKRNKIEKYLLLSF